jgi:chorismate synthase
MNSFGKRFTLTTFGESHGQAVGCVLDGVPAGLHIDQDCIQAELDRRKPGKNAFSTQRKEQDCVEILSGIFEGTSTGTPIAMMISNTDQRGRDYDHIKAIFRPGHADYTYHTKYGIRDYRGGGRSSARETAARVAAGSIAKQILHEVGITVEGGILDIGGIKSRTMDFKHAKESDIFSLDSSIETLQKEAILAAKNDHNSLGGSVIVKISNVLSGLGEPLYYKLDSMLADAMMSINASKAVEIGDGAKVASYNGLENNDQMDAHGFQSNHAGGVLGGISTGNDISITIHFKPTPSIFKPLSTINTNGDPVTLELTGRHDPCVAIRGVVVCESMAALVMADMLLLNMGRTMEGVRRYYGTQKEESVC